MAIHTSVDPEAPGVFQRTDYDEALAGLRRNDPVHQYRPGSWLLTRYDDVRAVSRDPSAFSSARGVLMDDPMRSGRPVPGSILHMDPPEHAAWRKLTARSFTPKAVASTESRLRAHAASVLDDLPRGEELDYVGRVAAVYPVLVIADLLGVADGDRADFRRWSDACIEGGGGEDSLRDVLELLEFLGAHADARRAHPADDVVSLVANASVGEGGCPIPQQAVTTYCMALLVAGNETTRHLLSGTAAVLSAQPDQRRRLVDDPSLIPGAVEEALRWVTPIQTFGRTAVRDVTIGDVEVAAGDWVALSYASANRDESVWGPDAGSFVCDRAVPPTHVAFGFGEHLCLGAALARLEARVFLEELLARFPEVDVVGEPTWVRSTMVRGMATLPVVLR